METFDGTGGQVNSYDWEQITFRRLRVWLEGTAMDGRLTLGLSLDLCGGSLVTARAWGQLALPPPASLTSPPLFSLSIFYRGR